MGSGVDHPFAIVPCLMLAQVKPTSVVVYAVLAEYANADQECWPSVSTVAKRANLAVRTVQTAVAELEEQGWLTVRGRVTDSGHQTSNLYKVRRVRNSDEVPPQKRTGTPRKKEQGTSAKSAGRTRPNEQDPLNKGSSQNPVYPSVDETRKLLDERKASNPDPDALKRLHELRGG